MRFGRLSVVAITLVILGLMAPYSFAANTIKVGIVDSYTGPAAIFAMDMVDGFKMAADEINAKGGILGRKIVWVTRDEKFQPSLALSMAKELVMKEKVDLLMGTISSASALAISDFAKKEKIPFFVTYAKSEKITGEKGHRYVFGMGENTAMAGKAAGSVLAKKPYTKYWIAGDDYEFGHAITDAVWNNIKALNPKAQLIGQTWWKVGEADFGPYITQIMAAKPDCLLLGSAGSSVVGFQKAAKASGLAEKVPFYQHTAIEVAVLTALGLNGPEGVYGTANYMFYYPGTPENKAFVEQFRKKYNRVPKMPAFFGFATAQFMARAYQKAGTLDREKFINALEGMVLENTAVGKLELRACDHQVLLPTYFGVTKKVPEYKDFLIGVDIVTVAPQDGVPTCAEIQKARAQAK